EAGLPRVDLNVEQPNLLRRLDLELQTTELSVWKAYLRWRVLDSASPFLSKAFAGPAETTRTQRWGEATEALVGDAVGQKDVGRPYPPAAKTKVQEMIRALLATLKDDIAGLDWMRLETRKTALAKLEGFDAQVGYPERWTDYAGVKL